MTYTWRTFLIMYVDGWSKGIRANSARSRIYSKSATFIPEFRGKLPIHFTSFQRPPLLLSLACPWSIPHIPRHITWHETRLDLSQVKVKRSVVTLADVVDHILLHFHKVPVFLFIITINAGFLIKNLTRITLSNEHDSGNILIYPNAHLPKGGGIN